jgi:hypothetical protein
MTLRWGRIAIAALAAEVLGVAVLVILVYIFGPSGIEAAQPFAERLGTWVGPISGFVLCLAGGYWVARSARSARIANGAAMGIAGAILDLVMAGLLGAGFSILLLGSNAGRIVGGSVGGWLASRGSADAARHCSRPAPPAADC